MERLNERLALAKKALASFDEVLALPYSKIVRDAAIQRFEFTFEALWKLAQRYIFINEGIEENSPKGVVRACFQIQLFDSNDTHTLLKAVDDRNLTSYTYNESLAEQIYQNLFNYRPLFNRWYESIEKHIIK